MAEITIAAVYKLLDLKEVRRIFRVRKDDRIALMITFIAFIDTLLVGVGEGVIAEVLFALLAFIRVTAYPRTFELGYVEREDTFLGQNRHPEGRSFLKVLVLRFNVRLYFVKISFPDDYLLSAVADRPEMELL